MLMKICPACGAKSFSAEGSSDEWGCPECGRDLSGVEAERPV